MDYQLLWSSIKFWVPPMIYVWAGIIGFWLAMTSPDEEIDNTKLETTTPKWIPWLT